MTDEQILTDVIAREGGYSNRAEDRGGPTNRGITLATLREWRCREDLTARDVELLTEAEAREIYRHRYISGPGLGKIQDDPLRALLVDSAVHSGPANAVRFLQRALNVGVSEPLRLKEDGVFGAKTLAELWRRDRRKLFWLTLAERMEFFGRLISHDLTDADRDGIPDSAEFASGWLNRLGAIMREAA